MSSAAPVPASDTGPRSFAPPSNLDGRGAKDWRKVADKVRKGELGEALHKLYEFEDRHGASPESEALRQWLESQPESRYREGD